RVLVSQRADGEPTRPTVSFSGPGPRKRQPLGAVRLTGVSLCEGEDSNLHGSYPASTSSWCVCHSATFAGWTTSETRGVAGAGKLGGSGVMSRPEKLSRFRL